MGLGAQGPRPRTSWHESILISNNWQGFACTAQTDASPVGPRGPGRNRVCGVVPSRREQETSEQKKIDWELLVLGEAFKMQIKCLLLRVGDGSMVQGCLLKE